jgi:hypothetical protein
MSTKFEVFCNYENFSQHLAVYIFANNPDGTRSICSDLKLGTFKTHNRGERIEEPTFRVTGDMAKPFLQGMANELHALGIKAEKAPVLENEMGAVKYHLEDMRKLVFEERIEYVNQEVDINLKEEKE